MEKKSVDELWESFWKPIVTFPEGNINLEQVKKELADFSFIMEQVPKVYCHITGSTLSKIMYPADTVIRVADDHFNEKLKEGIKEELEDRESSTGVIWAKATRENMRQSAILRDSVLPENYIHQWRVNGWNDKGVKFTNGILKEWWELEILNELPSTDAIIFDSQWIVGRSQERFKELGYRLNDWIAWYNGWKEGRADAVEDLMKRDNQIRQSKTNP